MQPSIDTQKSNNPEAADIFFFMSLNRNDKIMMMGHDVEQHAAFLRGYVKEVDIREPGMPLDDLKKEQFDKAILFLGKRALSKALMSRASDIVRQGGDIVLIFKNRWSTSALNVFFKTRYFKETSGYVLFDSADKPFSIIPVHGHALSFYLKNIRLPTMKFFKRRILKALLFLNLHIMAMPEFMIVCKKG